MSTHRSVAADGRQQIDPLSSPVPTLLSPYKSSLTMISLSMGNGLLITRPLAVIPPFTSPQRQVILLLFHLRVGFPHPSSASLRTNPLAGTSLLVTGLTSPESGQYSVVLDNDTSITHVLSAHSSFVQPDALLFFASGLDPQTTHNIEVQNVDGSTLALKFGGVEVIVQSPGVASPSTSWCVLLVICILP